MDIKEDQELVDKCSAVILSCETMEQLDVAITYSRFAYMRLAMRIGLINNSGFISIIERSIGFAQCKIRSAENEAR